MSDRIDKSMRLFEKGSAGKHVDIYRGIVELCSRFGYVSIREVMYGFDLPIRKAINRLTYLNRRGIVRKFDSFTMPEQFYCLTPVGREAVYRFAIADEVREFQPARDYKLINQRHERLLVKSYVALKQIFGGRFAGWVSEAQLKQEYVGTGARVVDGEFFVSSNGAREKCGLELELTMKAPARYRAQFDKLAAQVYSPAAKKQQIAIMLFLYESMAILERLCAHASTLYNEWGRCRLFFSQCEDFFENKAEARVIRIANGGQIETRAREIG